MPNYLRVGALSSLTGVSPDTLRAWERRYGLFSPARSTGRFRLYNDGDVDRVREMVRLIDAGVATSEAARRVLAQDLAPAGASSAEPPLAAAASAIHAAFRSFDETAIERAIDRVLAVADLDTAIRDVFLPALVEIGADWAAGTLSVAQEHFSVSALRARVMALARGWDSGLGPRALLACPPGEDHDVSLAMFGLALHRRGWRITFLGANTPLTEVVETQRLLEPRLTVLFSAMWDERTAFLASLSEASASWPLTLAGSTAKAVAEQSGCGHLTGDPISAAEELTREAARVVRNDHASVGARRRRGPPS